MIFILGQCLIMFRLYAVTKAQYKSSKNFDYSQFTASLWFRVMDSSDINTKILELQSVDEASSYSNLMTIELQQQENKLILTFKDQKYFLEIKESDNWFHLIIRKLYVDRYDEFKITLNSYHSSQQLIVKEVKEVNKMTSLVRLLYGNIVKSENIQIASDETDLAFACQPGCQLCMQDNLFLCLQCQTNRIIRRNHQSCEYLNQVRFGTQECLSKQQKINRYMEQQLAIDNLFQSNSNISNCQEDQFFHKDHLNTNIIDCNVVSKYTSNIEIIYFQVDLESSMSLQDNKKYNQFIHWNSSYIFYQDAQNDIFQLDIEQFSRQVKNMNVINQVLKPSCSNQSINFTIINMRIINETLNQLIFYQDINQLQVLNMTITNSHIEIERLFISKTILITHFKLINCTIVNSILFTSNYITIMDADIENCSFVNSSIIRGKLKTLRIINIILNCIKINSNSNLIHAWGALDIEIKIFEYKQISEHAGATAIELSGARVQLINITISNLNITKDPIQGMLSIVAQNLHITNISFIQIYGRYNRPFMQIDSQDYSIIIISQLNFESIYIEIGKLNVFIEIKTGSQGQTFVNDLMVNNLFITESIRILDIASEIVNITKSYFNISNLHSGIYILSNILILDWLDLDTTFEQNDLFTYFIHVVADSIKISQITMISRFLIFALMSKQTNALSYCQLINSYIYIQGNDLLSRTLISLDNFSSVVIRNSIFIGTGPFYTLSVLAILQVNHTIIKNCKISQICNFLIVYQLNHVSQMQIQNVSYNLKFENRLIVKPYFIAVFRGKLLIEDTDIISFSSQITLTNISQLMLNGFSMQSARLCQALLQITSTQEKFRISIQNVTFKDIFLQSQTMKFFSLIDIRSDYLILQGTGLTFHNIRIEGQQNKILQISSISQQIEIGDLILMSSQCQESCFLFTSLGQNSNDMKSTEFIISRFSFINNLATYLFIVQTYQYPSQQKINIINSTILQNTFSLTPKLQSNQLINLVECDIEYNTPPVDQSEYQYQHSSGREFVSDIQIYLSTDKGQQYALNRQLQMFKYEVKLKKRASTTNLFYIPTGQYFKDFILFNYKTQIYEKQSIQLYFSIQNTTGHDCCLNYLNQQKDFKLGSQNWDSLMITIKPTTLVQFNASCVIQGQVYSLLFFGKVLECQIGEIQLDDICIRCIPEIQQYSVKKYSSYCKSIDPSKMKEVYYGLINLHKGYWRPFIQNDLIEECNSYQSSCKEGYKIGNKICAEGYMGAICSDCDLYNEMGYGRYIKNSSNKCEQCQYSILDLVKFSLYVIISDYIILSNARQFSQISRLIKINRAVKSKSFSYNVPADRITIYTQFLLEYFQNITITNNYSITQLIPFIFRPNIFESASFTYMNYVDCLLSPYFNQYFWIYQRLLFLISCYIIIFNTYCVLYITVVKFKQLRSQFIMISIPILNLYTSNVMSFITQIILLLIPIEYSSKYWIQTRVSQLYFSTIHIQNLTSIVIYLLIIIIILPVSIYVICLSKIFHKITKKLEQSFAYLVYQFKREYYIPNYLIKLNALSLIIITYVFQRQVNLRILILILSTSIVNNFLIKFQIYKYRALNKLMVQIQLLFMSQLIITGIVEISTQWFIQYLFKLFYYSIVILITFTVCLQALPDLDLHNIKWTDKVRQFLGLQLRFYKSKQIKQRFLWIKNNLHLIIQMPLIYNNNNQL